MPDRNPTDQVPERDRLMTRPDGAPLPTALDPAGPAARGASADPKPVPQRGHGDPDERNPAPDAIDRSA